ncbi:MAG: flagellar hook-length control protein FliK [Solirubrobacteraceae bacterium]
MRPRATSLAEAVEHVQATIRLAAERGVHHARLALRPASLGTIDVHLRTTHAGLIATVHADSSEARHLLAEAGLELRRSLEDQGVTLLRLDIGHGQDGRPGAGAARQPGDDARPDRRGARRGPDADDGPADPTTRVETLELPSGVLVDVLA